MGALGVSNRHIVALALMEVAVANKHACTLPAVTRHTVESNSEFNFQGSSHGSGQPLIMSHCSVEEEKS